MILELAAVPGCYTMKNTLQSIARISRGASSIADNIKAFGARSTVRLIMEDGEEWTEGTFYSAIAYEKLCQKP